MAKKKPPQNPVLPEHIERFEYFLRKWQALLNLNDWRIVRDLKRRAASEMCVMEEFETPHKLVKYRMGVDFRNTPVTDESLECLAIHELLHLRYHEAIEAAQEDGDYSDRVMGHEHSAIEVLTNLLYKLAIAMDAHEALGDCLTPSPFRATIPGTTGVIDADTSVDDSAEAGSAGSRRAVRNRSRSSSGSGDESPDAQRPGEEGAG